MRNKKARWEYGRNSQPTQVLTRNRKMRLRKFYKNPHGAIRKYTRFLLTTHEPTEKTNEKKVLSEGFQ